MELLNATRMPAGYTLGREPSGRESLVVVVKGTFVLPRDGGDPVPSEQPVPFVYADTFTGEPGHSAPVHEMDFAPHKPRCDVLVVGTAYAPDGRPSPRVPVGLRCGRLLKSFNVVGNRNWRAALSLVAPATPETFVSMPISYDHAFGGLDRAGEDGAPQNPYVANPVGRGYHQSMARAIGASLPNTEEIQRPIERPDASYAPMALGPVGRGWTPRVGFGGTYDQDWLDHGFPFLPQDFDARYFQAAPLDQQIDYLRGGEEVVLLNLSPEGTIGFRVPRIEVPVHFFPKRGGHIDVEAVIDTLVLEPDAGRFTMTWRAALPLKKNLFEIAQVLVGHKSRGWWRARELGKTHFASLADAVADRAIAAEIED